MRAEADRLPRRTAEVDALFKLYSPSVFSFFGTIFARALKRDFRAVRLSRAGATPPASVPHLVLYSNHPSWWDAAVYVWLGATLFKTRRLFAPMEKAMVQRYGFMRRIGVFGLEGGSREGAALFLAAARRVLASPTDILIVTAQGRFADSRARPLGLAPGIAHVAALEPHATLVPLALDYAFWDERRPELFLRFGAGVPAAALAGMSRDEARARLSAALEETMDALSAEVVARNPLAFNTILSGSVGVGGVYDLWRRARAALAGRRFQPSHGDGR